jgi:hypothetical protein
VTDLIRRDLHPRSQPLLVRANEVHEVLDVVTMAEAALLFPHFQPCDAFRVISTRSSASRCSLTEQELRLESARFDY